MKTTHILFPFQLSLKLSLSEQKNDFNIHTVETPLSCGFGSGKHRCLRKISLDSTKLSVIICKMLKY